MRMKIRNGEQAFVVVPAIDTSARGLADVASHADALEGGPLAGARIGRLHGQMNSDERDRVMRTFRDGGFDVLVATVMVEVGVDIPGATVMVVEHAEQFGLAQLHQLRGRVGRGGKAGTCVFIADPTTEIASRRLDALAKNSDGFAIADLDLSLRGPGEFFGQRQSGLPELRVADLTRDLPLLIEAREEAERMVGAVGNLIDPDDALLRRKVLGLYGATLGLGDIG
jgi:ATP-dependent DNA helicase RecG